MTPALEHTLITADDAPPERWLYLLHGIYGSGRNWATVAKHVAEARPEWGIVLVDLRLHGGSTGFEPPHTLRACAADVRRLEQRSGMPAAALLGHSFGGKVALLWAAEDAAALRQVWVVDSSLATGEPAGAAWRILEKVRSLPDRFASRDELVDALEAEGYDPGVGRWLAMNLEREGDSFRWRLDWDGVEEMLRDYFATDVWGALESPGEGAVVHVVRAIDSDAIDPESQTRLEEVAAGSDRLEVHAVEGGHWVNVENPRAVVELLVSRLP